MHRIDSSFSPAPGAHSPWAASPLIVGLRGIAAGVLAAAALPCCQTGTAFLATEGDIVLHHSRSGQAVAIEKSTGSSLTHCGIVFRDAAGNLRVAEAVQPVRVTSGTQTLREWVGRSVEGRAEVFRLREGMSAAQFTQLWTALKSMHGRSYDALFQWADGKIYCSELVYDAFLSGPRIDLGGAQRFGDLDLSSDEVQSLIIKRYHDQGITFNSDEQIITPVALTRSNRLKKVGTITAATAPLQ